MVGRRLGLRALAVAAEVRGDDGEALRQGRGDGVPHHVRLGMAVEEQERRPAAPVADPERRLADVHVLELEAGEERSHALFSVRS